MAKIAIAGVAGRMGRTLVELAKAAEGVSLVAGFEAADSPFLGQDVGLLAGVGALNVLVESDAQLREREFDVLIDFTTTAATLAHLADCEASGRRIVIGTTGFGDQRRLIEAAATRIGVVFAPNMSVGVNLCFKLLELAAKVLGDENRWRELTTGFPMGRLATLDEVASTLVFLCSERSGYTSGCVVTVDGGATWRT